MAADGPGTAGSPSAWARGTRSPHPRHEDEDVRGSVYNRTSMLRTPKVEPGTSPSPLYHSFLCPYSLNNPDTVYNALIPHGPKLISSVVSSSVSY